MADQLHCRGPRRRRPVIKARDQRPAYIYPLAYILFRLFLFFSFSLSLYCCALCFLFLSLSLSLSLAVSLGGRSTPNRVNHRWSGRDAQIALENTYGAGKIAVRSNCPREIWWMTGKGEKGEREERLTSYRGNWGK